MREVIKKKTTRKTKYLRLLKKDTEFEIKLD